MRIVVGAAFACALSLSLPAWPQTAANAPAAFEVAAIKQNRSGDPFNTIGGSAGQFAAMNFPIRQLILLSFELQPHQLIGGPDWLGDRYDIRAKLPDVLVPRVREMLRALLADRFKLATHPENRELPMYALVMARDDRRLGPQLNLTKNDCTAGRRGGHGGVPPPAAAAPGPRPGIAEGPATVVGLSPGPIQGSRPPCGDARSPAFLSAGGITMAQLAGLLSGRVGRTVLDRTGLGGFYDLDLAHARIPGDANGPLLPGVPPPPIDPDMPSIFTALQEQLGLKLDAMRGPVEVTVIDRIERPTED